MPIHDWTKVEPNIFHDFHSDWIQVIKHELNAGNLPKDYYALSEQVTLGVIPDILAYEPFGGFGTERDSGRKGTTLVRASPSAQHITAMELRVNRLKKKRIAIRKASDDRLAAVIEIVSPGNKSSRSAMQAFVGRAIELLGSHIHLMIVDVRPPTRRDPHGIHSVIEKELTGDTYVPPADKPLTLASYEAITPPKAYVEPIAVGDKLPDMPLFLVPGGHVPVPLEKTYKKAFEGIPQRWRRVIEAK